MTYGSYSYGSAEYAAGGRSTTLIPVIILYDFTVQLGWQFANYTVMATGKALTRTVQLGWQFASYLLSTK